MHQLEYLLIITILLHEFAVWFRRNQIASFDFELQVISTIRTRRGLGSQLSPPYSYVSTTRFASSKLAASKSSHTGPNQSIVSYILTEQWWESNLLGTSRSDHGEPSYSRRQESRSTECHGTAIEARDGQTVLATVRATEKII